MVRHSDWTLTCLVFDVVLLRKIMYPRRVIVEQALGFFARSCRRATKQQRSLSSKKFNGSVGCSCSTGQVSSRSNSVRTRKHQFPEQTPNSRVYRKKERETKKHVSHQGMQDICPSRVCRKTTTAVLARYARTRGFYYYRCLNLGPLVKPARLTSPTAPAELPGGPGELQRQERHPAAVDQYSRRSVLQGKKTRLVHQSPRHAHDGELQRVHDFVGLTPYRRSNGRAAAAAAAAAAPGVLRLRPRG